MSSEVVSAGGLAGSVPLAVFAGALAGANADAFEATDVIEKIKCILLPRLQNRFILFY